MISKNVNLDSGFVASYWVVSNVNVDLHSLNVKVSISGYKDEAAFESGKDPVDGRVIEFSGADNVSLTQFLSSIDSSVSDLLV